MLSLTKCASLPVLFPGPAATNLMYPAIKILVTGPDKFAATKSDDTVLCL